MHDDWKSVFDAVQGQALPWLEGLPDRDIPATATGEEILGRMPSDLPAAGMAPAEVIDDLGRIAEGGLIAMASPRFHGWVIGGSVPAALGADWLVSAWDQNTAMLEVTPASVGIEYTAGRWLLQLLDLPSDCSVGFVTGGQMANFTCLAAGRTRVLDAVGWDVGAKGLQGAPKVTVIAGAARHSTIGTALRYLGLGSDNVRLVDVDGQDRMDPAHLERLLAGVDGPVLVIAAAGSIHSGDVDPIGELADVIDRHCSGDRDRAWLHVDGAIGLWGRASRDPDLLVRLDGLERADSWSTDGHKWLNTPYDCGIAITRDAAAHERALNIHAEYIPDGAAQFDSIAYVPEMSRRARGITVWAALRQLGRDGVADLVDDLRARTRQFADELSQVPGVEVLHEVVLNQLSVRFLSADGDHDGHTRRVTEAVRADGTCYPTPSEWHGGAVLRISVSNWQTSVDDVTRSTDVIRRLHQNLGGVV